MPLAASTPPRPSARAGPSRASRTLPHARDIGLRVPALHRPAGRHRGHCGSVPSARDGNDPQ